MSSEVELKQLGNFLHPGEIVLVSCNNLGGFGSRYSAALVTENGISWLDLDDVIDPSAEVGIAGVTATEKNCFLAIQGKRPRLVSLQTDLRPDAQFQCGRATDIHSLAERNGVIYAVATGRDQIVSIGCRDGTFSGPEEVCFAGSLTRKDTMHLNSICFTDSSAMLVSMFGAKPDSGTRYGAIVEADSGQTVCGQVLDPHSLTYLGDGVVGFCESLTSSFCLVELGSGSIQRVRLSGYTRGCTFTGRHFVVGSSRLRHKSRSLGSLREFPASDDPHGNPWQRSSLYFLNPDLSVAHRLDFTGYAPEIYDIVYLGSRFRAAKFFEDAAGRRMDAMYDEIHRAVKPAKDYYYKRH